MDIINREPEPEASEAFHICDERSANWLLRKLGNIEAEQRRVQAQAEAICKSLDNDAASLRYLYGSQLEAWVRAELQRRGGRSKSLKLLQGTCSFRTVPRSLKITDEQAAKEYAQATAMPQAVEQIERLRTAVYCVLARRALEETGEVLPGIEIVPERESFCTRFGKDAE